MGVTGGWLGVYVVGCCWWCMFVSGARQQHWHTPSNSMHPTRFKSSTQPRPWEPAPAPPPPPYPLHSNPPPPGAALPTPRPQVIASEVIAYLRESGEEAARREAVAALADLAERYAPDHQWFVDTVNQLFEAAGEAGCWAGAALGGGVGRSSRGASCCRR